MRQLYATWIPVFHPISVNRLEALVRRYRYLQLRPGDLWEEYSLEGTTVLPNVPGRVTVTITSHGLVKIVTDDGAADHGEGDPENAFLRGARRLVHGDGYSGDSYSSFLYVNVFGTQSLILDIHEPDLAKLAGADVDSYITSSIHHFYLSELHIRRENVRTQRDDFIGTALIAALSLRQWGTLVWFVSRIPTIRQLRAVKKHVPSRNVFAGSLYLLERRAKFVNISSALYDLRATESYYRAFCSLHDHPKYPPYANTKTYPADFRERSSGRWQVPQDYAPFQEMHAMMSETYEEYGDMIGSYGTQAIGLIVATISLVAALLLTLAQILPIHEWITGWSLAGQIALAISILLIVYLLVFCANRYAAQRFIEVTKELLQIDINRFSTGNEIQF